MLRNSKIAEKHRRMKKNVIRESVCLGFSVASPKWEHRFAL